MADFGSLSYTTIYESHGDIGDYRLSSNACFGAIFRDITGNTKEYCQDYQIYIALDDQILKCRDNNYCFLEVSEINRYLRAIKLLLPSLKWKIVENQSYKDWDNLIRIDINLKAPGLSHKFMMTYVRYLYEYPYNVVLHDAYRLKKIYKFESISNLYQLCALAYPEFYGTGHALMHKAKHCKNKKLKERIEYNRRTSLNSILEDIEYKRGYDKLNDISYSIRYWKDENEFEKRLEIYNKNYKKWRKESM